MAQPPRPTSRHTRAQSYTQRRPNRLSLSFPVTTSNGSGSNSDARNTPTSSNTPSFPPPAAESVPASPNDSNGFLVALAGQERRVLELKEELQKAEGELATLKVRWASHERAKKRAEIRHIQPLQPLQSVVTDGTRPNEDIDASRQSAELDRRKALLSTIAREPRRKVISGGHTRTLSLLSPDRSNYTQPFPPVQESAAEGRDSSRGTIPDTSKGITKIRSRHSYQSGVTGVTDNARQIAVDVKAGLWTFLEDLRQATVGDEPITGKSYPQGRDSPRSVPRRRDSPNPQAMGEGEQSTRPAKRDLSPRTWDSLTGANSVLLDAGGSYYIDARRGSKSAPPDVKEDVAKPFPPDADELDDSWGDWDSPVPVSPRWSGSTELSGPATPSTVHPENRSVKSVSPSTRLWGASKLMPL